MFVFIEDKQPLFEVVQAAGEQEYDVLLKQMKQNPALAQTLTTPVSKMPKYRFLFDDTDPSARILKYATLLDVIDRTMKWPQFETYFIKSSKGLYLAFLAVAITSENDKPVVEDVKVFSFGLGDDADENQIYKDLPGFLNKCLDKFGKVSWGAIDGNKANRAYEIYTKRHKGTITKDGKYIRYTCIK